MNVYLNTGGFIPRIYGERRGKVDGDEMKSVLVEDGSYDVTLRVTR